MKPGDAFHWQPRPFAIPHLPDALCQNTDPEIFYPDKGGTATDAKKVCRSCDEQDPCLQWALDHDERYGVWGGLSPGQRKKLLGKGSAAC